MFTSGFRAHLNGATEHTHHFLNSVPGIYCEHHQEQWEDYLQSAVYAHNVAPISGKSNIIPFSLVFGRDASSPETISLELSPRPLPHDHYAKHILSGLSEAHKQFSQIKADIRHQQCEIYGTKACNLAIPDGKIVYMCKTPSTSRQGLATHFIRHFDGPYQATGHPFNRPDMLTLKYLATGGTIPHPVNIEKVVIIPDPEEHDLQASNDTVLNLCMMTPQWLPCLVLLTMILFRLLFSSVSSSSPYPPNQPLLHKLVNQCMKVIHFHEKF